ncbi:MAG: hypothetical protein IJW60_00325 [Clostridia bacterium]|nr:hypothetical protein [Clostridia bacterium]
MKNFLLKALKFFGLDELLLRLLQRLLQGLLKKLEAAANKCSHSLERIARTLEAV